LEQVYLTSVAAQGRMVANAKVSKLA
jgi:hypothetical protein